MAKKKATHHSKPLKEDPDLHPTPPAAAMDKANGADSEKLDNLKSLNDLLVKETAQRRQQVASLLKSKDSLESELSRAHMDNAALQAELAGLHDGVTRMDLESGVVTLFVGTQLSQQAEAIGKEKVESDEKIRNAAMELAKALKEKAAIEEVKREKEVCIESLEKEMNRLTDEIDNERIKLKRVYAERDSIIAELDVQIEETNGLKLKLAQAEIFGEEKAEASQNLKLIINGLVKEREDQERVMEAIQMQKTELERALQTKNLKMEKLKTETEEITRLKEKAEDDRNEELKKNNKLQKIMDELNLDILNLKEKETRLHGEIEGLERWRIEATEKEKEMSYFIEVLVKEKMEKENRNKVLMEENGKIKKNLDDAIKEIDGKKRELEELVNEKAEKETEVIELQKELSEIRIAMSAIEESVKAEIDKNKQFQLEVEQDKEVINMITIERDEARKELYDEKQQGNNLMSRIETKEKEVEETQKLMEKMIAVKNSLLGERDDARKWLNEEKDRSNRLVSRTAAMEKEMEETQKLVQKMIAEMNNLLGERNDARNELADEKEQGKVLMSKISTMEKEMEEIRKLMEKMTEEKNNLSGERGKLEAHCETLKEDIASLLISLKKANEHSDSMKAEIESATANSKKVVGLLKNTRALVCNPKDERNGIDEDAEYEAELETIKNAFKNRQEKVEDMKRELELLQNSMEEANKKKSFLALLSSASTICLAAISFAYVAKGH